MSNRTKQKFLDPYAVVFWAVLLGLTVFVILRSSILPATIDEARTYFEHIDRGLAFIRYDFHGQNHTLQSIASYAFVRILGLSLFSLRLGSIVGFVIYVFACAKLCRIYTKGVVLYAFTLLALTANPLVLDMAVLARGYSLALGFFTAALAVCATKLQSESRDEGWKATLVSYLLISLFCSLSVASNLSFAFANVSLLVVYAMWVAVRMFGSIERSSVWKAIGANLVTLALPGAVAYLVINPAILRITTETIYFGSRSWRTSYHDLLSVWFHDPIAAVAFLPVARIAHYLIILLGLLVVAYVVIVLVWNRSFGQQEKNWLLLTVILTLTVAIHSVDHYWLSGRPLPLNRTGLFLVPLGILAFASSISGLKGQLTFTPKFISPDILFHGGRLILALLVIAFFVCLRLSWVFLWKYDSGAPDVVAVVSNYSRDHGIQKVGIEWHLSAAMRFHDLLQPQRTLPELRDLYDLQKELPAAHEALLVLPDRKSVELDREHLHIIYEHPLSEVVVAIRQ